MKRHLLILALGLVGCAETPAEREARESDESRYYGSKMVTAEFDGHTWVIMKSSHAQPIAHHPDCPCGKPERP